MDSQQQELKRLHRQYRILINDKHALKGVAKLSELRTKKLVHSMRKELIDLQYSLTRAERTTEQANLEKKLAHYIQNNQEMQCSINIQKASNRELDQQVNLITNKINVAKKNMPNPERAKEMRIEQMRLLERCENKLEVYVKQYCVILATNKKLREEVESLIKDRQLFNNQFNKYVGDLDRGKKILFEMMDRTKTAFDQREEFLQKMFALVVKSRYIYNTHVELIGTMKRNLDAQTQLSNFILTKGSRRIMADMERKQMEKKAKQHASFKKQMENYAEMINKIRDFVGESSINRICTYFVRKEDENFALFNYVNILHSEIATLSDETHALHLKIDSFNEAKRKMAEHQEQTMKELEDSYAEAKGEADIQAEKYYKTNNRLQAVMDGLQEIFDILDCTNEPLLNLLGNNEEINYHNVLGFLEIIDGKIGSAIVSGSEKFPRVRFRQRQRLRHKTLEQEYCNYRFASANDISSPRANLKSWQSFVTLSSITLKSMSQTNQADDQDSDVNQAVKSDQVVDVDDDDPKIRE